MPCGWCKSSDAVRIPRREESFLAKAITETIIGDVIFELILEGRVGFHYGVVEGKSIPGRRRI